MFGRSILYVLSGLLFAAQVWAIDEGIDYVRLPQAQPTETGDRIEVLEIFWYGCPHCWNLEPALQNWLQTLPAGAAFRRMPAMGSRWEPHARAYYAAEAMGKVEALHDPLFNAIHVQRRPIMTEDDLVAFAAEVGLDPDTFRSAYHSPEVEAKVRQAEEMQRRYGIDGVPTIVINGRYLTSASRTAGRARMIEVVNNLLTQELAATPPASAPQEASPPRPE